MAKISSTGKQFTITVPKELMKIMGWDEHTEIIISKYPQKSVVYIEKIGDEKQNAKK